MRHSVSCLAALLLLAGCQAPRGPMKPNYTLLPAAAPGGLPLDSKDQQPVLLGVADRAALLAHREVFRTNTAKITLLPEWKARWKAIDTPTTLVVAFGSWCGDTHRELPDLLALMETPTPCVKVHFLGVYRDKQAAPELWPAGIRPEPILKVPTLWAYTLEPGGGWKLVGSIVENPPVKGQRMAEGILDLVEKAR